MLPPRNHPNSKSRRAHQKAPSQAISQKGDEVWKRLAEFAIASAPGNEVQAMRQVVLAVSQLSLSQNSLDRLKTAVAEAVMNAIEHGHHHRPDLPVNIQVLASPGRLAVRVTNQSDGLPMPQPEIPDIEAKLAGRQSPRGWGLFLIKNLMDELHISHDEQEHTLELILYLTETQSGKQ